MTRPRLLDLFCGAGGASVGYARAGFEVIGVDVRPQPHYPFAFHQGDALDFLERGGARGFDVVHASPPCQRYSKITRVSGDPLSWPDLVGPVRERLSVIGVPWVIENVVGAPLRSPAMLCGTSFGVPMRRHRLFESSMFLWTPPCAHRAYPRSLPRLHRTRGGLASRYVGVYGGTRARGDGARARSAMGIDWMTREELVEAVPPVYAEWVGRQVLAAIGSTGGGVSAGFPLFTSPLDRRAPGS